MIVVSNITPAKNATNFPVDQDLEIRVTADFKLDPRNISFRLNEVDIIPNVFSVYHGANDHELIVILYTRKRIKYGDAYRYGQDNIRYGMRDVYSSVLNYGSRYICSFKVWGTNDLEEKEEIQDSFVFTTEEGIFYNANPIKYFYSDYTQSMANKLPEWSKGRYDKYSNFQQYLNPMGEVLEKNQDLIDKVYQSNLIQTVDLKEMSTLYKYELDKNFEFETLFNQDGSMFYIQPDVSGIQGITRFDLFASETNDLKSLYYKGLPTRLDSEQVFVGDNEIFPETEATNLKIKIDKELKRQGTFALYCTGVNTSVFKDYNKAFLFLKCKIKGISLFDSEQEEEIVVYNGQFLFSKKMWRKIDSVQFYNLNGQPVKFRIVHFPDNTKSFVDTKKMILPDGTSDFIIWAIEERDNKSVLQKKRTLGQNGLDVLKFSGATEVVSEFGLYDINSTTPLNLIDITPDYNSNYLYGISNDYLYIFDKREPYPTSLKKIPGDNGSADFCIHVEADETFLDEDGIKEINFKFIHSVPGKKIIKYRLKITKPDLSVCYLLKNGTTVTDANDSSIFVKQDEFMLPEVIARYNADMVGEYIFELETLYQGGNTTKDYAFVFIKKIAALAKYKIKRILNDSLPVSIIMDTDQFIKIFTNDGVLHTIQFHKDGIVIDYTSKIIYSSEEYTSIDVD